ncbi:TPA: hypothetical protein QH850_001089 [Enterobacter chengduensis]|nr:hypothetical protein [Enterobacter chengduensis]
MNKVTKITIKIISLRYKTQGRQRYTPAGNVPLTHAETGCHQSKKTIQRFYAIYDFPFPAEDQSHVRPA